MAILLLAGLPGTGKTTISHYFREKFSAPLFTKDKFKEIMFDEIGFKSFEEKDNLDRRATKCMVLSAKSLIQSGKNVILESNFSQRDKELIEEIAGEMSKDIVTLRLDCELDTLWERLLRRDFADGQHPGHSTNKCYPLPPDFVPEPMWSKEEFYATYVKTGVVGFEYNDTFVIDTTDFSKIDYEGMAEELSSYMN